MVMKQAPRVLIVEDDPMVSEMLLEQLEQMMYRVVGVAIDGGEAVVMTQSLRPDVILMDIRLPDINGFDVTKKIREFNSRIPIIAQTAYAMAYDEKEAYRSGCTDFISKPIKQELLLEKLSTLKESMNHNS